jgi:hypothetical protein
MKQSIQFIAFVGLLNLMIDNALLAQEINQQDNLNRLSADVGVVQTFDNRYEGVKGSPTLFEDFIPGKVRVHDGNGYAVLLNFDAFNKQILLKRNNEAGFRVLDLSKVVSFTFMTGTGNRDFVVVKVQNNEFEVREILYEGKITFYRIHKVILEKADYQGAYSSNRKYDEFVHESDYFSLNNGKTTPFKLKIRSLEKSFPGAPIDKFLKENKLDFSNDTDLIKLFKLIDSV